MEKFQIEENRIYHKIKSKKIFQVESWEYLDFILCLLVESGYKPAKDLSLDELKSKGIKIYFERNDSDKVLLIVDKMVERYIQVIFF